MLTEVDDKQLITITPEWMEQKFDEMNVLLFGGMLPKCKFSLFTTGKGSQGHTLGWFKTNRDYQVNYRFMNWSNTYRCSGWQFYLYGQDSMEPEDFAYHMNPLIQLNGNYTWTEKAALSTLVHEMCHYRQHLFGFYEATRKGTIHHGVTFQRIAEQVSKKSNDFFTVEKIARAEQMEQMDFTDAMKAKHAAQASKGIHFFKFELAAPESASRGVYQCAYAIPASTIYKDYLALLPSFKANRYKRIVDCVTTDGNIKKYHTVKRVGSWYYSQGKTVDDVMPDVRVDSQTEIQIGGEATMSEPYYIFKLKYKTPYYNSKFNSYKYAYKIAKPTDFYIIKNYINSERDKYSYACWCEVYDAKILNRKLLKADRNYITNDWNILPDVKQGEYTVLFGDDSPEVQKPAKNSLETFLYGDGGNPHLKAAQPKRYSFTMKVMSRDGKASTFTITNATEEEAKQQMRQRFPNWTEAMIDTKFKMYTQNSSMVGENISRSELQQLVEQVVYRFSQEQSSYNKSAMR